MTHLYNFPSLKDRRRYLRKQPIPSEARFWLAVKNRQFLGLKFRRQYSIGMYIVDFYCPKIRLAVEIDGISHFQPGRDARDIWRQRWLEDRGISVIRFLSSDVMNNLDGVLMKLHESIDELTIK